MSPDPNQNWQSALRRIYLKEAHSTFSVPIPVRDASGGWSVWLGGVILAATVFLPNSDGCCALAADKEPPHPTINVSVHEGLLTLQAVEAPLADVLGRIGDAAGFRVVFKRSMDAPVSWTVTDVPLEKALRRLLGRRSYVITYDEPQAEGEMRHLAEVRLMRNNMPETGHSIEIDRTLTATAKIEAQNELLIATPDDDRDTRLNFVRNMSKRPKAAAVNALRVLLSQDEDSMIRRIAAIGLGKARGEAALEALAAAVHDEDASVRRRAIQGLGRKRDDRAVHALGEVLFEDPDSRMRRAAVHGLRMIGTKEASEVLHKGKFDPDNFVRRDIALALARMQNHETGPEI